MYCKNCGKPNDNDAKFCVSCGQSLTTSATTGSVPVTPNRPAPAPPRPVYKPPVSGQNINSDTGYFVIALLMLAVTLQWFVWENMDNMWTSSQRRDYYKTFRYLTILFVAAQFAMMVVFVRNITFKIICGVIGLLVVGYDIYILAERM